MKILSTVKYNSTTLKLPNRIQIQTTSYCNAFCRICPYSRIYNKVKMGLMTDKLFKKIIKECVQYNIKKITPYLFNEPFMDPNMIERVQYIRQQSPTAYIQISTNGFKLNEDFTKKLMNSGLNELRFSIHSLNKKMYSFLTPKLDFDVILHNLKQLLLAKKPDTLKVYLTSILVPSVNEKDIDELKQFAQNNNIGIKVWPYWDRAGNVEFTSEKIHRKKIYGCKFNRDTEQFHVLFNGDVVLCCMDWQREVILGNVNNQSIQEIWTNDKYKIIRKKIHGLIKTDDTFICKRCICSKENK